MKGLFFAYDVFIHKLGTKCVTDAEREGEKLAVTAWQRNLSRLRRKLSTRKKKENKMDLDRRCK